METVVGGTPQQCLEAVQAYFIREWPYPGQVHRSADVVVFSERQSFLRWIFTGGSKGVQVFASAEGAGQTRLTITAGRSKYAQTIEKWVSEELPKRVTATQPSAEVTAAGTTDIPEQIRRLAELRDSGAITDAEFERKKAELLDRM